MQKPFPALIPVGLKIALFDHGAMTLDSFLAPRLQSFRLLGIQFSLPSLQKFFYLPPALTKFAFEFRIIPGSFHPKEWSLAFPL